MSKGRMAQIMAQCDRLHQILIQPQKNIELLEQNYLSKYAALSRNSRGRDRQEAQCDIRISFIFFKLTADFYIILAFSNSF